MTAEFKVEGFDELFKTMEELSKEIGQAKTNKIWRSAMAYAIEPVLQDAKAFAPRDTGQLEEHIYSAVHRPKGRDKASNSYAGEVYIARVSVSPKREKDRLDVIINKKGKFQTIRRMKPVGVSQEFGNAHVSPHPFLRPALENNIDRITSRLGQAIWSEIQWGKYNNDKSKG